MERTLHRDDVPLRHKIITWCCVGLQLLPPVSGIAIALPASAADKQQTQTNTQPADPFAQQLAGGSVTLGTALSDENRSSSQALSDYARGQAGSALNNSVQDALSPYGTVRAQINLNNNFALDGSSLDMLVPLYDAPSNLLFTQLGGRRKDDRTTLNAGVGSRFFPNDKWMFGVNTFFDNDITGRNYRLGVGGEAWADYLKLSANGYQRLNSWHQSRDFADYDERPANGYDVRMNGFLPAYPQLGGKLVWEQYYGKEVALFGKDQRQKDPYAVTLGVIYTPVPMLSVGADQRLGKSGKDDFSVNLAVTYQVGKSWAENALPEAVDAMRKLGRTRYDLVERNNDIILEYRKQEVIKLQLLSSRLSGEARTTIPLGMKINSKYPLKSIRWDAASFISAGGKINAQDSTRVALTLPAWQVAQLAQTAKKASKAAAPKAGQDASRLANTYVLTAVALDNNGNESKPVDVTVEVLQPTAHFTTKPVISGNDAAPDGKTAITLAYHITDSHNMPLAGQEVTFTITFADGSTITKTVVTDVNGNISLPVTSMVAGQTTIVATLPNGESSSSTINFSAAQPDAAHSSLKAVPAVIATGGETSTLTLTVHDVQDRPVSGLQSVKLQNQGVSGLTINAVKESAAGVYTATVSGNKAGNATFTAQINSMPFTGPNAALTLSGNNSDAQLTADHLVITTDGAVANDFAPNNLQVTITDSDGTPLANQTMAFVATNGATVAASAVTDTNGQVTVPVTSRKAGKVDVTVSINGKSRTATVTFVANPLTAHIEGGALSVTADNAAANGTASNSVKAVVTDAYDNPLSGYEVNFSADNSAQIPASVKTDDSGSVSATLTSLVAGVSHVSATAGNSTQSVETHFTADGSSATISSDGITVVRDNALANGSASNQVQVQVKDGNGNPVSGMAVNFSASNGGTVAAQATTDTEGRVTVSIENIKAGVTTVTASVNGSSQKADTTFVADASTMKGSFTTVNDNAAASGTATNTVQLTLKDANGNPLADSDVTFSANNSAVVETATGKTDATGQISTTLTNTVAGDVTVTAKNASGDTLTLVVHFTADSSTATIEAGNLTVTADNATANNIASNRVRALVTDAHGNPVSGLSVAFAASNSATVTASATTDSDGIAIATLQSKKAGVSQVTATAKGNSQTVNTTFVADRTTAQLKVGALTVSNNDALANGSDSDQVQVQVTDKYDNPVNNIEVNFTASNGAIITASVMTDDNGVATSSLTSTTAGASNVVATVNGSTQGVSVNFNADSSNARISAGNMTVAENGAATNGSSTNAVRVLVTDSHGNILPGMSVNFTASNGATIAASGTTDSNGVAYMPVTSTTAGDSTITATVNGSSQSVTVTFVADGSTAQIQSGDFTVTGNNAVANGSATNRVQAVVTDAGHNPISGKVVDFSADNGATIAASGTTDASGKVIVTLTSLKAGVSNVTATINGGTQHVNTTFVADSATARIAAGDMVLTSNNAVANGVAADTVQVTVSDANGNPVANQSIAMKTDNAATTTIASSVKTDSNGQATVSLSSNKATDVNVTATVNGSSQSVTATFVADLNTAVLTVLNTSVNNAVADGSTTNQVEGSVEDAKGNPAGNAVVTLSASNSATVPATVTTDESGNFTAHLNSTKAGTSTVTARLNGNSLNTAVNFVADSSKATIAAGNMSIVQNNALANASSTNSVKVKVTDANGNPVAAQKVSFTASNGAVIAATGTTDASGVLTQTLTSTKAGASTVTATVNGNSQSVSVTFIADVGTAAIDSLTVSTNNALANGTATNALKVVVKDKSGNLLPAMVISLSADNGAIIASTATTDSNGEASVTLTSKTAGASAVTATVKGNSKTASVTFVADTATAQIAAGNLVVTANNAVANNLSTNAVQVKVTDAQGNPLANQSVTMTASNSATISNTAKTDANGLATVTLTSKVAGQSAVTATVNGSSQSVNVTFVANASTAQIAKGDFVVLTDNAAANGVDANRVQAQVFDAYGNPLVGVTVNFSTDGSATVASPTAVTDTSGRVTMTVTSTLSTMADVYASINGSKQTVFLNFWADPATANIIAMNVQANNAKTDGQATNSVQVTVTDAMGHKDFYQNIDVSFTADNGAVIAATGKTNTQGMITVPLTSTTGGGGISNVTATVNGSSQTVQVAFVGQMKVDSVTQATQPYVAVGQTSGDITVKIVDANNGNPYPQADVSLSIDKNTAFSDASSGKTDSAGKLTLRGVTGIALGASTITAKSGTTTATTKVTVYKIVITDQNKSNVRIGDYYVWATVSDDAGKSTAGIMLYATTTPNGSYQFKKNTSDAAGNIGIGIYRNSPGPVVLTVSL